MKEKENTNLRVLAFLARNGMTWFNQNKIAHETKVSAFLVGEILKNWKKRKIVEDWNNLTGEQKQEAIKNQAEIQGSEIYKISKKGIDKFEKIRNNCLDEETKEILKIKYAVD